jgi:hypothetical protein
MTAGFEQGGVETFMSGRDRRNDAAGSATVDHNIEAMGCSQRTEGRASRTGGFRPYGPGR